MPGLGPVVNREVELFTTGGFVRAIRFKFIKQTDAANIRGRAFGSTKIFRVGYISPSRAWCVYRVSFCWIFLSLEIKCMFRSIWQ